MVKDVIVVGCGIVGATIALALRKQGRQVLILDSNKPLSGTKPSGGHLKPSWLGGMPKSEYVPAMEMLEEIWGMEKSEFQLKPTGLYTTVHRVNTEQVIQTKHTQGEVNKLICRQQRHPIVQWASATGKRRVMRCSLLIVATGVWCQELLPNVFPTKKELQAKQGVSFRIHGSTIPFIKPWAPYKQVVAHQQSPGEIWVGDGSAILPQNWHDERTEQCLSRCLFALRLDRKKHLKTIVGLRAYCKSSKDPCVLKKVGPSAYVVTGAAKMGTIAAGWAARRIIDVTC